MNNRHEGYSNVNRYAQSNRYNQQGNYSQQNRRQQVQNGRPMNNAPQRSGAVPSGRRTFSKPQKRSFANRVFKDRRGKLNVLGRIAVGVLTISTLTGAAVTGKYAYDTLKFNSFVHSEDYQKIVEAIKDNYDNSEYLQVSIPRDAYDEYTNGTLKNAIKNEPNMQSFLETEEFDPSVWAYLLTGESDRSEMSNEEILDALTDYLPYAEYDNASDKEEVLDNSISNFAIMFQYCTNDKNKNSVVNLLDSVIGQNSISNSIEALNYEKGLNEEKIERIEYNKPVELQIKCNINDSFSDAKRGMKSGEEMAPYVYKFHNSRADFINGKLKNPNTSKILKKALSKYDNVKRMDGASVEFRANLEVMMNATKFARYDEYIDYASLRNDFYKEIMEDQNAPEDAISKIEADTLEIEKRIDMQEIIERFDMPQYMKEINQLLKEVRDSDRNLSKAQEMQNHVDEKYQKLGFDGFDR